LVFSSSSPPRLSAPPSYNPGMLLLYVVDSVEKVSIWPKLLETPKIEKIDTIFSAKIKRSNERNKLLTTST
jgi:hypothetical protein